MRSFLKRSAEAVLGSPAVHSLSGAWLRGRLTLAYHNVLPPGVAASGDRSLHCPFDQFRRHLDMLQNRRQLLGLADLLATPPAERAVSITFDDAYAGALEVGLPELSARRIPATVFVAPGLLGAGTPWWDALAGRDGLTESVRRACLDDRGGAGPQIMDWARQNGHTTSGGGESTRITTEAELLASASLPGIVFAAHSWSHPNLTRSDDRQIHDELGRVIPWLESRLPGKVRKWLAYPYGLHDARVRRAAEGAGYEAAFAVSGGWSRVGDDRFAIPRLNVPAGLSAGGLAMRLNGLFAG